MVGNFKNRLKHFLKQLLGLVEIILFFRLVFKYFGASPESFAIKYLYLFSDFLIWPFRYIFSNPYIGERLFDLVAFSAMAGYLILVLILLRVFNLFSHD
ncbi:MAG: hypothetical protein AAB432_02020 [Patescibacteria group bacterium]